MRSCLRTVPYVTLRLLFFPRHIAPDNSVATTTDTKISYSVVDLHPRMVEDFSKLSSHICQPFRSNLGPCDGRVNVAEEHEDILSEKVKKMPQGFYKVPYFFNATYFLMEIKDLVMYPKG